MRLIIDNLPLIVVLLLFLFIFIALFVPRYNDYFNLNKQMVKLRENGFLADYIIESNKVNIVFNDAFHEIAFVFPNKIKFYSYNDIITYRWHWVESNGMKLDNYIHFQLRDKNRPIIKILLFNANYAEYWMAKLDAIFS